MMFLLKQKNAFLTLVLSSFFLLGLKVSEHVSFSGTIISIHSEGTTETSPYCAAQFKNGDQEWRVTVTKKKQDKVSRLVAELLCDRLEDAYAQKQQPLVRGVVTGLNEQGQAATVEVAQILTLAPQADPKKTYLADVSSHDLQCLGSQACQIRGVLELLIHDANQKGWFSVQDLCSAKLKSPPGSHVLLKFKTRRACHFASQLLGKTVHVQGPRETEGVLVVDQIRLAD